MYVIELHDDDTNNAEDGSLAAYIGRGGTIYYAYQVEMHLQDVLYESWRRAYVKTAQDIKAVWARDTPEGELKYLARTPDYDGEWVLPFVGSPEAKIAVGVWGTDAVDDEQAKTWAVQRLTVEGAITAVLMDRGDIRAAWEIVDGVPTLVARGPREPRPRQKR